MFGVHINISYHTQIFDYHAEAGASTSVGPLPGNWLTACIADPGAELKYFCRKQNLACYAKMKNHSFENHKVYFRKKYLWVRWIGWGRGRMTLFYLDTHIIKFPQTPTTYVIRK